MNRASSFEAKVLVALGVVGTLGEGGGSPHVQLLVHVATWGLAIRTLVPAGGLPPPGVRRAWGLPLAGFLVWATWAAVLSPRAYTAALTGMEMLLAGVLMWLAAACGRVFIPWAAAAWLGWGNVLGLWAVAQRLSGVARPQACFVNPNDLAVWLAAALLFAWGIETRRTGDHESRRVVAVAAGSVLPLAALMFSGSRAAVLALAAGGAVLLARAAPASRLRRAAAGLLAAALVAGLAGWILRRQDYDPFRYHRLRIWSASLALSLDHPWFGAGPGQFEDLAPRYAFPQDEGPLRYERIFQAPHSDLLRLPGEFGWPAAVLALAAIAALVADLRRKVRPEDPEPAADAALVGLAAASLVMDATAVAALYTTGAMLLGARIGARREHAGMSPEARRLLVSGLAALLAADIAAYGSWLVVRPPVDAWLARSGEEPAAWAVALNRLSDSARASRATVKLQGPLSVEAYAEARADLEAAAGLHPRSPRYPRRLARLEARALFELYGDVGTLQRAERRLLQALERTPKDATLWLELADLLARAGERRRALDAAERALRTEPRALAPRWLQARLLAASGVPESRKRALAVLEEAESIAEAWNDWNPETAYGRALMRWDRQEADTLRRRLEKGAAGDP